MVLRVCCSLCGEIFQCSTNNKTILFSHIQNKHPEIILDVKHNNRLNSNCRRQPFEMEMDKKENSDLLEQNRRLPSIDIDADADATVADSPKSLSSTTVGAVMTAVTATTKATVPTRHFKRNQNNCCIECECSRRDLKLKQKQCDLYKPLKNNEIIDGTAATTRNNGGDYVSGVSGGGKVLFERKYKKFKPFRPNVPDKQELYLTTS